MAVMTRSACKRKGIVLTNEVYNVDVSHRKTRKKPLSTLSKVQRCMANVLVFSAWTVMLTATSVTYALVSQPDNGVMLYSPPHELWDTRDFNSSGVLLFPMTACTPLVRHARHETYLSI